MRRLLMTAAATGFAAAAFVSIGSTVASAGTVCLTDKEQIGNYQSCEFYSFRECRASSRGIGGTCVRNPYPDEGAAWGGPFMEFGSSYNRYDGPAYGGGYYQRRFERY